MGVDYEAFAVACMSSPDAAEMYNNARHVAMESSNIYNDGIALWDSGAKQVEDLKISYEKKDSTLYCAVSGRIDTISAPALMEVFENNYDGL